MGLDGKPSEPLPGAGTAVPLAAGAPAGADADAASAMDLRRTLLTVWRARWLVLFLGLLGFALAQLQLLRSPPLYTAETTVLWEVNQGNVVDIDPVARGLSGDLFQLASQIEVLGSSRLLGRVVDRLQLTRDPLFNPALAPPPDWTRWLSPAGLASELAGALREALGEALGEALPRRLAGWLPGGSGEASDAPAAPAPDPRRTAIAVLRGALEARWLDGTYVLTIRVTLADARRAAEVANAVAEAYIGEQLESKFEATRRATAWLGERVAELRADLEAAERAVKEQAAGMKVAGEEGLAAITRQLNELRERLRALETERDAAAGRLARLEALRARGDFTGVAELAQSPRLMSLASEIALAGGSGGNGANGAAAPARSSAVARFDAELAGLRGQMRASLARLDRQIAGLRASIAETTRHFERESQALVRLRQLQREAEASRLIYEAFLARLKETSVQEGIQRPDARVLNAAAVPLAPSAPNRPLTLLAGTGGGVLLALVLIFLRERLDTSFRTPEEIEAATGLPVIGLLPAAPAAGRRALLVGLATHAGAPFAEAVRNLRTSILLANVDRPPRVIMLASALPGEGKTTACLALAQVSRALGRRVLVVECDLRRRVFAECFAIGPGEGGLVSLLAGAASFDEALFHDRETGLDVLAGGRAAANAADLFSSRRFAAFLDEARARYDMVFLDTPPVLAVPDARVIGRHADATVLAVRWASTPRESVLEAVRLLAQVNIHPAGIALTQVDTAKLARYGYATYRYRQIRKYYRT